MKKVSKRSDYILSEKNKAEIEKFSKHIESQNGIKRQRIQKREENEESKMEQVKTKGKTKEQERVRKEDKSEKKIQMKKKQK